MKKYSILGSDNRNLKLKELYIQEGNIIQSSYKDADVIIGPTPFSKDDIKVNGDTIKCDDLIESMKFSNKVLYAGSISNNLKAKLRNENIKYVDLLEFEELAILNAIPTAEGAIMEAISGTDITIHSSNCLVLGYGRIGKVLSKMLDGMGANVFCEARKKKDIAMIDCMGYNNVEIEKIDEYINKMDIIFNTVPFILLDKNRIDNLKPGVLVVDLASVPGGIDFSYAKEKNINVKWALAIPGKVAPLTAAKYYKEIIDRIEGGN